MDDAKPSDGFFHCIPDWEACLGKSKNAKSFVRFDGFQFKYDTGWLTAAAEGGTNIEHICRHGPTRRNNETQISSTTRSYDFAPTPPLLDHVPKHYHANTHLD